MKTLAFYFSGIDQTATVTRAYSQTHTITNNKKYRFACFLVDINVFAEEFKQEVIAKARSPPLGVHCS